MSGFMDKLKALEKPQYSDRMKLEQLTDPAGYKMLDVKKMDTKFGKALLATIEDPKIKNKKFSVYLPRRYAVNLTDEEIVEVLSGSYRLKYTGSDNKKNPEIEIVKE